MLGPKRKDDFEPHWQDENDGLALSNSRPPMIQRPGSLLPRSSGAWSAMQISRTHARGRSSVILTPALMSFYFPFRLLRRKTSS
jgi:hypothetical protein